MNQPQAHSTTSSNDPIEHRANHTAKAANALIASESGRMMSGLLPLMLSLGALLLAAMAFYLAQSNGSHQQTQLETLAMRIGSVENQATNLQHHIDKMGSMAESERAVLIHNELSAISASLHRIAPLAQGEQQVLIGQLQQLLEAKPEKDAGAPTPVTPNE